MAPSLVEQNLPSAEYFTGHNVQTVTKSIYSPEDVSEIDLGQSWSSAHGAIEPHAIKASTFLKAAWILTLRCFQPEEVIHMSYDEELVPRSGASLVLTVRVNPDWNLRSLLETLEVEKSPAEPCPSIPYGAWLLELPPSRHIRPSALRFLTVPEKTLIPSSLANENLEVS